MAFLESAIQGRRWSFYFSGHDVFQVYLVIVLVVIFFRQLVSPEDLINAANMFSAVNIPLRWAVLSSHFNPVIYCCEENLYVTHLKEFKCL